MESCEVLVLGGAGYIGGKVVDVLQNTFRPRYVVEVIDSLLYESRYLKGKEHMRFRNIDIRDTSTIAQCTKVIDYDAGMQMYEDGSQGFLYKVGTDVVVILAAIVGDAACNVNQKLTEEVNYQAVKRLCKELDPKIHVVFASTCSVYGANEEIVDENSATKPLSSYASTKLRAEKHVLDRHGTVFRIGTVFGLGDEHARIRADLVVNTLTIKAFVEKEITVNGGEQWRPIISVKDIAGYIEEACRRKKEVSGVYNIGYKNVKIAELADAIVQCIPGPVKVNKIPAMFEDERNYKVSTEKARKIFEYEPKITVTDEVSDLIDLLRSGRIKNPMDINYHNGMFLSSVRL